MRPLNKTASAVLDVLFKGLEPHQSRTIDNTKGAFMPVHVEYLGHTLIGQTISIAHYYTQNGDLVPDPEGTFFKDQDGHWYPEHLQLCTGHYTVAVFMSGDQVMVNNRASIELASFGNMWLRNIKEQQGLKPGKAVKHE